MQYDLFCPILVLSSLIYITNFISTLYKKYYLYCILFFCLTITSVIVHSNTNIYTTLIDKIFVLSIVLCGGHILYNKLPTDNTIQVLLIVITFLLCIYLYYYGYFSNNYCYHPDKCIGDKYHGLLHLVSSFGHHLITFL